MELAQEDDLDARDVLLLAIAAAEALCLDDPAPLVRFVEFGDSAVVLRLCAWCKRKDYLEMKTNLCFDIKKVFDQKKITIPFPQLTVHQETS